MSTIDYYDNNAEKFCSSTVDLDLNEIYQRFLSYLPKTGTLLDAGCGSGRDAFAFKRAGYDVVAFDASLEMVKQAGGLLEQPVLHMRFEDMEFENEFDGIWACASLLHVSREDLPHVLHQLAKALKPSGILYVSFKYGETDRNADDGRNFTDLDERGLNTFLEQEPLLALCETWLTHDCRPGRASEKWLNAVLKRM